MFKKIVAVAVASLALSGTAFAEPGVFHTGPGESGGEVHGPSYQRVNGEWRVVNESSGTSSTSQGAATERGRANRGYIAPTSEEAARALSNLRFQGPGGD